MTSPDLAPLSLDLDLERAAQSINQFLARFPEQAPAYKLLAMHVALPLVLTPELLNYLRTHFLRGQTPWVAEADLLLSDLCRPVGYEQYVMDTAVRAFLLAEMKADPALGRDRMTEVARLLISYIHYLYRGGARSAAYELQAQQWAAMVYLDDQRSVVERELIQNFENLVSFDAQDSSKGIVRRLEAERLLKLTQSLLLEVDSFSELLQHADLTRRVLLSRSKPAETYSNLGQDVQRKQQQSYESLYQQAISAQKSGEWAEAIQYLERSLQVLGSEVTSESLQLLTNRRNTLSIILEEQSRLIQLLRDAQKKYDEASNTLDFKTPQHLLVDAANVWQNLEENITKAEGYFPDGLLKLRNQLQNLQNRVDLALDVLSSSTVTKDALAKAQSYIEQFGTDLTLEALEQELQARIKIINRHEPIKPQNSYDLVSENFNLAELKTLVHELNIVLDDLLPGSRRDNARELISYLTRHSRLLELFELLARERPHLDLAPYFHELIAQQFNNSRAMTNLFDALSLPLRDFQERERRAWGSSAWTQDKAEKLQTYFYERGEWARLLQTVATESARTRLPLDLATLERLFPVTSKVSSLEWLGKGRRWAVLVGVDQYEDWQNYAGLQVCVKDARAMREALLAGGYEPERIQLLTDDGPELPTRVNILSTLQEIADATKPNDLLLFYYSGHCSAAQGDSYLVARDGRFNVLADTAISVTRVKQIIQAASARAKLIILDAAPVGAPIGMGIEPMSSEFIRSTFGEAENMAIFASCKQGEKSYEWRAKERSVFTHYLLKAMTGVADEDGKGFVSVSDVGKYVVSNVKLWAVQQRVQQTPTLELQLRGDIILTNYDKTG